MSHEDDEGTRDCKVVVFGGSIATVEYLEARRFRNESAACRTFEEEIDTPCLTKTIAPSKGRNSCYCLSATDHVTKIEFAHPEDE